MRRKAGMMLVALGHALAGGLVLHALHRDMHEGEAIGPLVAALRDSALAWPGSMVVLALALTGADRLAAWAGLPARSGLVRLTWVLASAFAYALLSLPAHAALVGLVGAEHGGPAVASHAVRDAGVTFLASFAVLSAGLAAARLIRPVAPRARVRRGAAWIAPPRAGLAVGVAATIALGVVLTGPKGFETAVSNAWASCDDNARAGP
jgi:hypothetical protein